MLQVGIRSCDLEEMQYVPKGQCFLGSNEIATNPNWIDDVLAMDFRKSFYINNRLDAFDPSFAPSTGTPNGIQL